DLGAEVVVVPVAPARFVASGRRSARAARLGPLVGRGARRRARAGRLREEGRLVVAAVPARRRRHGGSARVRASRPTRARLLSRRLLVVVRRREAVVLVVDGEVVLVLRVRDRRPAACVRLVARRRVEREAQVPAVAAARRGASGRPVAGREDVVAARALEDRARIAETRLGDAVLRAATRTLNRHEPASLTTSSISRRVPSCTRGRTLPHGRRDFTPDEVPTLAENPGPAHAVAAPFGVRRRFAGPMGGAVREGGLEPPRVLPHRLLRPARLPVPPLSRALAQYQSTAERATHATALGAPEVMHDRGAAAVGGRARGC